MKKISISKIDDAIKNQELDVKCDWNGNEITVKKYIGYDAMIKIVNNTVSACFNKDGEYAPEMKDFEFRSQVIESYSNVSLPSVLTHRYDISYSSGLFETIVELIDYRQIDAIREAIDDKIDYISDVNVQQVYSKIEEVTNLIQNTAKEISNVFGGITKEDMQSIMNAITDNKIDEEKIVEAYIRSKNGTK